MRKSIIIMLIVILVITMSITAMAGGFQKLADPSNTTFIVDGRAVNFDSAYNIDGTNYIQLRSVAKMLNGTISQFNVYWDEEIGQAVIETGEAYTGAKPVIVEKDIYYVGDIVRMNGASIVITDIVTTNKVGSFGPGPGKIFHGISFSLYATKQPYADVSLQVYHFIQNIVTKNGRKYADTLSLERIVIDLNEEVTGTIYYTLDVDDQIDIINVRDAYSSDNQISVYAKE